jgi:hypothetical protein
VIVGAILMIIIFVLMLSTRDFARELQQGVNVPPASKAGVAFLFARENGRPGLPEPDGWA